MIDGPTYEDAPDADAKADFIWGVVESLTAQVMALSLEFGRLVDQLTEEGVIDPE